MCVGFIIQQEQQNVIENPAGGRVPVEGAALQIMDELEAEMANVEHLRNRSIREMERLVEKKAQLELDRTEDAMNMLAMAAVHPITVVRALMQFGYEPFPTSIGRRFGLFGRPQLYLPNIFSYMKQLASTKHVSTLFEGLDSAICVHVIGGAVDGYVWDLLAVKPLKVDIMEEETFGSSLRFTLRLTLTDMAVKIATRPFKVVMLRQIACIVGGESVFSTMKGVEIGVRSGWTNLFSGLSTELRNVLLGSFLAFIGRYAINRIFMYHYDNSEEERRKSGLMDSIYETVLVMLTKFTELGLSVMFQSTVGCPLEVTSKIRAIAGTGLAASRNLPLQCKTHQGAWDFLASKNVLLNASRWFFRSKPLGPGLLPSYSS